jgi:N utilization substance protein B
LINPHLKNWDHDRVAVIDMILIKLAITEFLYFESIPTKVTINEYLEVAKMYSTPKSNEFINGLLDTILVLLKAEGKVQKSGRGLEE